MPGFTTGISGRESNTRDVGLIPGTGRSPREGNGTPLQYCCLENFMDRGAWVENSMAMRLQRSDTTENTHAYLMPWFLKQENYPVNNTVVNVLLLYSHAVVTKYLNPVNCNRLGLLVPHHLWNFPKFMFNELVMPSSHLILWCPFSFCPQSFPVSGIFQWVIFLHQMTKDWSFRQSISPSNEYSGLISLKID